MTTTHTPGPWRVQEIIDPVLMTYAPEVIATQSDGSTRYIARLYGTNADVRPSTDSNARLLAAAPELLHACRVAQQYLSDPTEFGLCVGRQRALRAIGEALRRLEDTW